jgi:predicted ATPase
MPHNEIYTPFFSIHVENFGEISSADIDISPLTLFVGDNSSGKSYLLNLIYGIFTRPVKDVILKYFSVNHDLFLPLGKKYLENNDCDSLITKIYYLTLSDINLFFQSLNEALYKTKDEIINTIFQHKINIDRLSLTFKYDESSPISICFLQLPLFKLYAPFLEIKSIKNDPSLFEENQINYFNTVKYLHYNKETGLEYDEHYFAINILNSLLETFLYHNYWNRPEFIPSGRTGLINTYIPITQSALNNTYIKLNDELVDKSLLTVPIIDFIKQLISVRPKDFNNKYHALIEFFEKDLIDGTIIFSQTPIVRFYYQPFNTNIEPLPMHVCSAVVTETLPIYLSLSKGLFSYLFIEEPEIGLHPALQIIMSRLLVKLVNFNNKMTPIIIATHSVTIVQYINNMVLLNLQSDKDKVLKQYNLQQNELIDKKDIHMYQFRKINGQSVVEKIAWYDEEGFFVDTFIDTYDDFLQMIVNISGK